MRLLTTTLSQSEAAGLSNDDIYLDLDLDLDSDAFRTVSITNSAINMMLLDGLSIKLCAVVDDDNRTARKLQ